MGSGTAVQPQPRPLTSLCARCRHWDPVFRNRDPVETDSSPPDPIAGQACIVSELTSCVANPRARDCIWGSRRLAEPLATCPNGVKQYQLNRHTLDDARDGDGISESSNYQLPTSRAATPSVTSVPHWKCPCPCAMSGGRSGIHFLHLRGRGPNPGAM